MEAPHIADDVEIPDSYDEDEYSDGNSDPALGRVNFNQFSNDKSIQQQITEQLTGDNDGQAPQRIEKTSVLTPAAADKEASAGSYSDIDDALTGSHDRASEKELGKTGLATAVEPSVVDESGVAVGASP
jgi:hypothetical protein